MKTSLQFFPFALALACVTVTASATCPPDLQADELINCIRVEGAGMSYESYLEERSEWRRQEAAKRESTANANDRQTGVTMIDDVTLR